MKKLKLGSLMAGGAALLAFATPASAGTLTVTSGPIFTPPTAFTNNTITIETLHNPPGVAGDLVKLSGGTTITPPASTSAAIDLAGGYSANAGDLVSVAYTFTIDSSIAVPVTYTASGSVTILGTPQNFSTTGTVLPGLNQYRGTVQAPISFPIPATGTFTARLSLDFSSASGATPLGGAGGALALSIEQMSFQLAPTAAATLPPSKPLNVATRLAVETGDNALIGGFIITGTDAKRVIIRGIGPSLSAFFTGVLADPTLELYEGSTLLASNDNWRSDQQTEIEATGIPPTDDFESAIVRTLTPGGYTAILRGKNNTIGIGVVEAYDLDPAANSELGNISTRGLVQTDNNVMIGGFILGPNTSGASSVVVRGIGPSLAAFGVPNTLQDPILELHDSSGALIASNDDWMSSPNRQTIIDRGLAPTNDKESAVLAIPAPGSYTAIVRGVNNTAGVGLVEVYHLQ